MKTINNNIQEARVGFPNAKLLKEKEFEVKCTHYYILNFSSFKADFVLKQFLTPIEDNKNILQLCNTSKQPHLALAPTLQTAIDWIKANSPYKICEDPNNGWNVYVLYDDKYILCKECVDENQAINYVLKDD